jgi:hypothetical protein
VREVRAPHSLSSSDAARRESGHAGEQGKEGQGKREEHESKAGAGVMRLQAKLLMPSTPLTTTLWSGLWSLCHGRRSLNSENDNKLSYALGYHLDYHPLFSRDV